MTTSRGADYDHDDHYWLNEYDHDEHSPAYYAWAERYYSFERYCSYPEDYDDDPADPEEIKARSYSSAQEVDNSDGDFWDAFNNNESQEYGSSESYQCEDSQDRDPALVAEVVPFQIPVICRTKISVWARTLAEAIAKAEVEGQSYPDSASGYEVNHNALLECEVHVPEEPSSCKSSYCSDCKHEHEYFSQQCKIPGCICDWLPF